MASSQTRKRSRGVFSTLGGTGCRYISNLLRVLVVRRLLSCKKKILFEVANTDAYHANSQSHLCRYLESFLGLLPRSSNSSEASKFRLQSLYSEDSSLWAKRDPDSVLFEMEKRLDGVCMESVKVYSDSLRTIGAMMDAVFRVPKGECVAIVDDMKAVVGEISDLRSFYKDHPMKSITRGSGLEFHAAIVESLDVLLSYCEKYVKSCENLVRARTIAEIRYSKEAARGFDNAERLDKAEFCKMRSACAQSCLLLAYMEPKLICMVKEEDKILDGWRILEDFFAGVPLPRGIDMKEVIEMQQRVFYKNLKLVVNFPGKFYLFTQDVGSLVLPDGFGRWIDLEDGYNSCNVPLCKDLDINTCQIEMAFGKQNMKVGVEVKVDVTDDTWLLHVFLHNGKDLQELYGVFRLSLEHRDTSKYHENGETIYTFGFNRLPAELVQFCATLM